MPTNRVEPNWCCDVCDESYGAQRQRAEACEAKPVASKPRAGALVLRCDHRGPRFVAVTEVADKPERRYHGWRFYVEGQRDGLSSGSWQWAPEGYATALAGTFNHLARTYPQGWAGDEVAGVLAWAHASGLVSDKPGEREHRNSRHVVGPLSPAHRELLDVLELRPTFRVGRNFNYSRTASASDLNYVGYTAALIEAGGVTARAAVTHSAAPLSEDDLLGLWRRWWDGEDVSVPLPRFQWCRPRRSADNLTASKLRKPQLAALGAAGVEWKQRTEHDFFVRQLLGTVPMEDQDVPQFGRPTIAVLSAKGGVGKSTVTAALGAAYAHTGKRVLIVDCDPRNSSQAALWDLGPLPVDEARHLLRPTPAGVVNVHVLSPGQFLPADEPAEWAGTTQLQWLEFVAANTDLDGIDIVLLDLPAAGGPFLDAVYGWQEQTATAAVLVATGHRVVREATTRWAAAHRHLLDNCPTVLVENQSHIGREAHIGGSERVIGTDEATAAMASSLQIELATSLPIVEDHLVMAATASLRDLAQRLLEPPAPVQADDEDDEDDETTIVFFTVDEAVVT